MTLTKDMRDFIALLIKHKVEYILVGGFAVICHGYVRTTQDIDFFIYPSEENAENMMRALIEFGFGNAGIPKDCFMKEGTAIHLGVEPNRIDLITCLHKINTETVFQNMQQIEYQGATINIISKQDLIAAKKAAGRAKDLADVEELEKI